MSPKIKAICVEPIVCGVFLLLVLSAGSAQAFASQPRNGGEAISVVDASHAPVILRTVEREEISNGVLLFHKDVYFTDPLGDAVALANRLAGTDPEGGIFFHVADDPITASTQEQKQQALVTSTFGCPSGLLDPFSFTVEDRVRDQAGNLSEPIRFTISCVANPPSNAPYLIGGGVIGLILLVTAWLFFRSHPGERGSMARAIVMFFCMLLPATFILLSLHEAGHAFSDIDRGLANMVLFVHPFSFSAYSRPMFEWNNVWQHAAGATVVILGSLLISVLLWRYRSISTFALAALFPMAAMNNGIYILSVGGDFRNIMNITGLPSGVFNVIGFVIAAVGVLGLLSLLPLLGLSPMDKRALLVLPAGYFLWALLSMIVAYLFVPSSLFAVRWHLTGEILQSANSFLSAPLVGLAVALLYLTLYRWLLPRTPAWLRTTQANPAWKDLRIPGLLATVSVIAGLLAVML